MIKKIAVGVAIAGCALMPLAFAFGAEASTTPMSPTELGVQIDNVNGYTMAYVGILLTKFWPFLLGAIILLGVLAFGKRIAVGIFH